MRPITPKSSGGQVEIRVDGIPTWNSDATATHSKSGKQSHRKLPSNPNLTLYMSTVTKQKESIVKSKNSEKAGRPPSGSALGKKEARPSLPALALPSRDDGQALPLGLNANVHLKPNSSNQSPSRTHT